MANTVLGGWSHLSMLLTLYSGITSGGTGGPFGMLRIEPVDHVKDKCPPCWTISLALLLPFEFLHSEQQADRPSIESPGTTGNPSLPVVSFLASPFPSPFPTPLVLQPSPNTSKAFRAQPLLSSLIQIWPWDMQ